jgi:hypothetical protein
MALLVQKVTEFSPCSIVPQQVWSLTVAVEHFQDLFQKDSKLGAKCLVFRIIKGHFLHGYKVKLLETNNYVEIRYRTFL